MAGCLNSMKENCRGIPRVPLGACLAMVCVFLTADFVAGEDAVIVATGKGRTTKKGEILDFTGKQLVIRTPDGNQLPIPAKRVIDVKTSLVPQHLAADRLFEEHRFQEAFDAYRLAQQNDSRIWMRRQILSRQVSCLQSLGQHTRACETFLLIVQSDPSTQFYDAIPLAWQTVEPSSTLRQRARGWLQDREFPAARLLAASWVLPTEHRNQAIFVLKELRSNEDQRVAHLATAQLWRTQVATASLTEVHRWNDNVGRISSGLGQGFYFPVGQAYFQHQRYEEAALALMRIPILGHHDRQLTSESLLLAAAALEKVERPDCAHRLYREILTAYGDTASATLARVRLNEQQAQDGGS